MLTSAGVLAPPHLPHPPADGSEQPEQLPGYQDQGHGGRGLVGVRPDDPEREGVGHGAVRVPGVGEEPHHQQQAHQPQCYRWVSAWGLPFPRSSDCLELYWIEASSVLMDLINTYNL